jgi:sugar lactone lactonase YvrE
MKRQLIQLSLAAVVVTASVWAKETHAPTEQNSITIEGIALNPEGIEYDSTDKTFLLSSLNAQPIIKVNMDGTYKPFTSGEKFPLSTAGLQIDAKHNRLLVAGFNGTEIMDKDPKTKGVSFLRIYNLKTGLLEKEINLSSLAPEAAAYFANDIAVDAKGNAYITDWYAGLIYKVDMDGKATIFWKNSLGTAGGPNGIDFHKEGYLLASIIKVNDKGIYESSGLVKIPIDNPKASATVAINDAKFAGFDGMVITPKGTVIGVSNDGKTGGGNMLIELSSKDSYQSAQVIHAKAITPSTTVALTPSNEPYVINQDFSDNFKKIWKIEKIKF